MLRQRLALALLVTLAGCSPADPSSLSRDEARSMAGSAADSGRDLCEDYGWYGDGEFCDEFCPRTDPDCQASCSLDADCPPIFCAADDCAQTFCNAGACAVDDQCTATLRWLQKDAYLSRAGRSMPFWPPHTTMTLTLSCGGVTLREAVMVNHGTAPDATDAAGAPILEEVWRETVEGTRAELTQLADAFEGCECGTTFLSLDSLDATLQQDLVEQLATYVQANLDCPASVGGTDAIVMALGAGDIETVVANASACTWTSGADWATGLDEALTTLAASTSETLADYHVCNNDALLQADLVARFRDGDGSSCDGASALCAGPSWFYDPAP